MLSMLLLLAAVPQAVIPDLPPGLALPPAMADRTSPPASMPVIGRPSPMCEARPTSVVGPRALQDGARMLSTSGDVGLYRLLDRYVNGCPEPIIVNDRVPGSNAVGREILAPGVATRIH
jgi:hypothetical protein